MYRVLLVDDEYMIVNGLKKLISWQEFGFEVVGTAANGQEALDYVRKNPIDLVVVDVNMPVLSGIDFVAKAREEGIPFRFIMLSGYQEFQYVKDTLKLGTENYLLKPVNKTEMVETLQMVTKALKQDEQDERDQGYLAEYFMLSWIHGDIIYSDLSTYLIENKIDVLTENYTVVFIKRGPDETQIQDYLIAENQPLVHYALEIDMWLLIYLGDKMPLKVFNTKDEGRFTFRRCRFSGGGNSCGY
ncbi:response regulator [Listeria fleischmannii]|uniref:Response regulator n=1 Tax=Listeria fleischmannii FSL S10-1203 TaxID=1265822 RepID=W7DRC0_9LIST|nr:response regulator [Listeria fleischmannii]EUJ47871.1 response regulator [Listeria fleischmannii FSL S10-1203]